MKLSECLNGADIHTLRRIAEHYELSCSKHSKLSLLQEILFAFGSRSFLEQCASNWRRGREAGLLRLVMDGRQVFSAEELGAFFHVRQTHSDRPAGRGPEPAEGSADRDRPGGGQRAGKSGNRSGKQRTARTPAGDGAGGPDSSPAGELEQMLAKMTAEGWLFPTTRFGGRVMYCVPAELCDLLREHLLRQLSASLVRSEQGPLTYREEDHAMARDLDVFLEYVRHHTVKLTTDGSMYKKNLLQVLELLEVPEEPLQGGWRFGYGRRFHDYPDRFALMYDYAYHHHLIEEREDGILAVGGESQRWLQTPMLDRQRGLVRFYVQLYRRAITRLPLVAQLIARLAVDWVDGRSMLEQVGMFVNDYYYDSQQQVWETRILKMLMHLGVIRTGHDENGTLWFQMTKLGQQLLTPDAIPPVADEAQERQRMLIVQPNFEIVVTADQPAVTAALAQFTELRQAGVVRVYRISEDAVRRGLQSGQCVADWLSMLNRHAQTPVPGNVERTLKEWERLYTMADGSLSS
ncbi:MAG: helicase-associated domain-containing protein [Alicyclobacillus sp.]|nr:helicase-associated domain-containing protein [Alicyclobacillus sp.]